MGETSNGNSVSCESEGRVRVALSPQRGSVGRGQLAQGGLASPSARFVLWPALAGSRIYKV